MSKLSEFKLNYLPLEDQNLRIVILNQSYLKRYLPKLLTKGLYARNKNRGR